MTPPVDPRADSCNQGAPSHLQALGMYPPPTVPTALRNADLGKQGVVEIIWTVYMSEPS